LLDDKVARRVAVRELMHVKGTLGIVADAARAGLLGFGVTAENCPAKENQCDKIKN
jgi:hypothetical protein